jgi:hypothetical protein
VAVHQHQLAVTSKTPTVLTWLSPRSDRAAHNFIQRINHRVAGHSMRQPSTPSRSKFCRLCTVGKSKSVSHTGHARLIHSGKGCHLSLVRQTSISTAHPYFPVVRGQGCTITGWGVALHQHPVRWNFSTTGLGCQKMAAVSCARVWFGFIKSNRHPERLQTVSGWSSISQCCAVDTHHGLTAGGF